MNDQNPLAPSLRLLWHGLPEPEKGPKPKLTLRQIVDAGIALADEAGLEGLSMRTLAKDLGVGTMSLYRYVPSKTELLALMLDAVTEPDPQERDAVGQNWRIFLEATAWSGRRLYLRHPWVIQANWTRPVMGPNSVAGLDLSMSGLKGLPLSDRQKMGVLTSLDSYVQGTARQEILWQKAAEESGVTDEEFWNYQLPEMGAAMVSGRYPHLAALSEDTFDGSWEDTFVFGLTLFLDGLEQQLARLN